ncbi:UDP-N-acetylglucosamine transferase subunit ALG13 [Aliiruegeria haliotis]|uniref:UDP-N-acetylglucosamine transferase subunit ALG13 n=1 Tax=Aliiruegeria haliotis TaxID=1280846 RepID=A0A2T0RFC1_9RHOB|nr:glycosyltransferase [Aliiruegeria haliotis]PRY19839.1 UDP-N-acetylglucosamine transferase subunit ALG13 [Aliiruegeria haliotis]
MILVTIGMQLPFPRLLTAMDGIAARTKEPVLAQTGPQRQGYKFMETLETIPPSEYEGTFERSRVVVGHAGIGTILTAKKIGKPLIIFPRRHSNGEHRNDHQVATAQHFEALPGIHIAWDEDDLEKLVHCPSLEGATASLNPSYATLLHRIESFIDSGGR